MDIDETLYHLYLFIDIQKKEQDKEIKRKLNEWGFSEDDFN